MPTKSAIPNPQSAIEEIPEIRFIRRLIRQTHRDVRHGYINYLAGMRLIARLTESLARLLQTNHRLNSTRSSAAPSTQSSQPSPSAPRDKCYMDLDDPRFDPDRHEPLPTPAPNRTLDPPYSQSDYAKLHPW